MSRVPLNIKLTQLVLIIDPAADVDTGRLSIGFHIGRPVLKIFVSVHT